MRLKISELWRHPAYHQILNAGKLTDGGTSIQIGDVIGEKILSGTNEISRLPDAGQKTSTIVARAELTVSAIETICEKCEWFFGKLTDSDGGRCEHSGCLPCVQKSAGGLAAVIRNPHSICPAGKWTVS